MLLGSKANGCGHEEPHDVHVWLPDDPLEDWLAGTAAAGVIVRPVYRRRTLPRRQVRNLTRQHTMHGGPERRSDDGHRKPDHW